MVLFRNSYRSVSRNLSNQGNTSALIEIKDVILLPYGFEHQI